MMLALLAGLGDWSGVTQQAYDRTPGIQTAAAWAIIPPGLQRVGDCRAQGPRADSPLTSGSRALNPPASG